MTFVVTNWLLVLFLITLKGVEDMDKFMEDMVNEFEC